MVFFVQITLNCRISGSGHYRSVLRGFPGTKKEQTEPETGLFYPWGSSTPYRFPGICCQTISSVSSPHQAIKVSTPSTDPASLIVKTSKEYDNGKKISQFFRVLDVPNHLYFIKCRSDEKNQNGSPSEFSDHPHRCVNGFCTSHVFLTSAISLSIQSWTRSFISWLLIP